MYDQSMIRAYIADALPEERSALRSLLRDLNMEVVGEASDWPTAFVQVPLNYVDLLLVDWDLLPTLPGIAIGKLRDISPNNLVIVLISRLDARQQAATSMGADLFISKDEMPENVVKHLKTITASIFTK